MKFRSLRWRLSLTYAGIALFTALVSGGTLLLILRSYYQGQELAYLKKNATAISAAITPLLSQKDLPADLKSHLALFAFLSQTHVRLLDAGGKEIGNFSFTDGNIPSAIVSAVSLPKAGLLPDAGATDVFTATAGTEFQQFLGVDSGSVGALPNVKTVLGVQIALPDKAYTAASAETGQPQTMKFLYYGGPTQLEGGGLPGAVVQKEERSGKSLVSVFPAVGTMFGFDLQGKSGQGKVRSSQVFRQEIFAADGSSLGSIELSEGPANGLEIVWGVARGWALASLVAVALAIGAGWLASRRMAAPLLALTGVTAQMAGGDLSARADDRPADEFGALGRSFNEMATRVEEMVKTLRNFVADAAHELNTPLTALRTNLELAGDENDPDRRFAYMQSAQAQLQRLHRLVRDLLDLSRLETGVDTRSRAPLNLAEFALSACEPYAAQAEQASVELNVRLPEQEVFVLADEKQMQRALGNLLDNALKFTPAGGVVTLSVDKDKDWACLCVSDTGIGIPPEDLAGLFERFHRGRNAAPYPGSGLGLAIVKAIAQAHGGRVSAENALAGACFTLRLPALALTGNSSKLDYALPSVSPPGGPG